MFFNPRALVTTTLISLFAFEASALVLKPLEGPAELVGDALGVSKRAEPIVPPLEFVPVSDLGVLTHGHSLKRETPGDEAFDPTSRQSFYWGALAGSTLYKFNFTLANDGDDEFILPIENFAKRVKSIDCGAKDEPMVIEFSDDGSYKYATKAWDWVNKEENNRFTLVTAVDQCFKGDDRTPYLVTNIEFNKAKKQAKLIAKEKQWSEVAERYRLVLTHENVPEATANVTHPHLMHMKRDSLTMDLSHSFNQNIFNFNKGDTSGLDLRADAQINTAGQIITDLDISWGGFLGLIPDGVNLNIHPQGVYGQFMLTLAADGTLGKGLDWTMSPEITIPVGGIKIAKIIEIGPFVTMGLHFGSESLSGSGTLTTGAKATIQDSAKVVFKSSDFNANTVEGWTPQVEKIDPQFSAAISGNLKAWAELGIVVKAEVFGKWGYQAGLDAQLPYFEATLTAKVDTLGVCGTQKTTGVEMGANVGINVNLNAGQPNKAPDWQKDLFNTAWPLFSTCLGIGPDNAATPTPTPTPEPTPESSSVEADITPTETGAEPTPVTDMTTEAPATTEPPHVSGTNPIYSSGLYTGTASGGWPVTANSTFMRMARRKPTALYM